MEIVRKLIYSQDQITVQGNQITYPDGSTETLEGLHYIERDIARTVINYRACVVAAGPKYDFIVKDEHVLTQGIKGTSSCCTPEEKNVTIRLRDGTNLRHDFEDEDEHLKFLLLARQMREFYSTKRWFDKLDRMITFCRNNHVKPVRLIMNKYVHRIEATHEDATIGIKITNTEGSQNILDYLLSYL